jgi:hypothetical protein
VVHTALEAKDTTLIGWQGITVRVPSAWELGAIGGTFRSGSLRLDDGDRPRLEVKWSFDPSAKIEQILDKYLRTITKKTRGRATINRQVRVVSKGAKPQKSLCSFGVDTEAVTTGGRQGPAEHARGVIWRCKSCHRIVLAQVVGWGRERVDALASEVLGSLEDHGSDDRLTWAVYGMICRVPQRLALEGQKLMAGYLELSFLDRQERLQVRRWGMAGIALETKSLREWIDETYASRREVVFQAAATQIHGHEAVVLSGHRRRFAHRARYAVERALRLRRAVEWTCWLWCCPESNRIHAIEHWHREGSALPEVAESVVCHPGVAEER